MAESRTLRSSKRRKVSDQTDTNIKESGNDSLPKPRSSSRFKIDLQTTSLHETPPLPSSTNKTTSKRATRKNTTAHKDTNAGRLKSLRTTSTRQSRRTDKNAHDEDIWEVPTEDDEIQTIQETYGLSTKGEHGTATHAEGEELFAIKTQLQLELGQDSERDGNPENQLHDSPCAAELKSFCESNGIRSMLGPISRLILDRIHGRQLIPLCGLSSEYHTVHQLMEQTVLAGEGNSLLLLGARGCGKTAVVETAISSLSRHHGNDFHVVRLNGFLHTDDKIALREIWHQLGRENNIDDELAKTSTYADTMASLLALLSEVPPDAADSITTTKSVIIILDEFDLFIYHPRQTLLYNLFDIAQAKKAPIAVIGLTTKVDVMENLEKRVKSRFSHRYTFLPRPHTLAEFSDICASALRVDRETVLNYALQVKHSDDPNIESAFSSANAQRLIELWNSYVQELFEDDDFHAHLKTIFYRTKCPKDFFTSAILPMSYMALDSKEVQQSWTIPVAKLFTTVVCCPDPAPFPFPVSSTASSSTLSLPLSLLLTATRLTALHDPSSNATQSQVLTPLSLTFPAVYAEYVRLLTSAKALASASGATAISGRIWGKESAREAWEKLVSWGLAVPASGSGIGDGKAYRVEISFEEVVNGMGPGGAGVLGRWWRDG